MTGRYDRSEVHTHAAGDTGSAGDVTVTYLVPRILPPGSACGSGAEAVVAASEVGRPDLLAFRALRQPLLAYTIADASDAMDLIGMCPAPGARVELPRAAS